MPHEPAGASTFQGAAGESNGLVNEHAGMRTEPDVTTVQRNQEFLPREPVLGVPLSLTPSRFMVYLYSFRPPTRDRPARIARPPAGRARGAH